MFVRVCVRASAMLLVSILFGSCASLGPVRGIPPSIQASDVEVASGNVHRILYALGSDTGVTIGTPDAWYLVCTENLNPDVVVMKSAKDRV